MKKILVLMIFAALAFAGSAFAGATGSSSAGQTLNGGEDGAENTMIGKLSTGVSAGWATAVDGYALTTFHTNGSQMYGSAHDSTSLYRVAADALAAPEASDSSEFADWTEL